MITDPEGDAQVHTYFPFGEELVPGEDDERMKFTGHERDLGVSGQNDDLDYMHARFCSPMTGRFLSVDPEGRYRAVNQPQLWGRYAYAAGNPLKYKDPNGQDLKIVYDFSASGLTQKQQLALQLGVRGVFTRAGVKNVQSYTKGGSIRPTETKPSDRVVGVTVTSEPFKQGNYGQTSAIAGNHALVSTAKAPDGEEASRNFMINVTAHEVGHSSDALPQYAADSAPVGSLLNPVENQAEPGTTMETHITPEVVGERVRDFSEEDAERLRRRLNDYE
jgi:RHS repeat-associated protein